MWHGETPGLFRSRYCDHNPARQPDPVDAGAGMVFIAADSNFDFLLENAGNYTEIQNGCIRPSGSASPKLAIYYPSQ
jgi:hypothetical protein